MAIPLQSLLTRRGQPTSGTAAGCSTLGTQVDGKRRNVGAPLVQQPYQRRHQWVEATAWAPQPQCRAQLAAGGAGARQPTVGSVEAGLPAGRPQQEELQLAHQGEQERVAATAGAQQGPAQERVAAAETHLKRVLEETMVTALELALG